MKKLADILSYPYTDEEYLTKKRRNLEKDCTAACDEVRELSKNPVFTKRTVASAEQLCRAG